jgi:hypothetical protein
MAMIAGAAGQGLVGAWPQLKVVSVRATDIPTPGRQPTFEFDNYSDGMRFCLAAPKTDNIKAADLALASNIPPTSDQAQSFAKSVQQLQGQNVAVVAAAGNSPGAVQEPGAEPGVFSVGAVAAQAGAVDGTIGAVCHFSANQGVGIYAPGCVLDTADPFTDEPYCCEDGTSEASAFTAAVIVALMSYDPKLTYARAEQLLVSTQTASGNLDVAAAFHADGLDTIISQGQANIPKPPPPMSVSPSAAKPRTSSYSVRVRAVHWRHGILIVTLAGMHRRDRAHILLRYTHGRARLIRSRRARIKVHTRKPRSIVVHVFAGRRAVSPLTTVNL